MPSEVSGFPTLALWKATFLLTTLAAGCGGASTPNCTERRCLAQMLIDKELTSQPQYEECINTIYVPFIEYQTLAVDTKNLRLHSRLLATIVWVDSELSWNESVYSFEEVVLPVDKVWTPELHVTNGIVTTMRHSSRDLLVLSNGTVQHTVIINAEVNCEVNLFNYPFAGDECPVAIQTWSAMGCGTKLEFGDLKMIDGTHGDWQTDGVALLKQRDDRNYILVALSIKPMNPFITLLLPSILLILADVVSFALPLGGGERNSFKVTLVLSFTMFLIILNEQLPGDGQCSPIIRTHFCICLVFLVLSMLMSMIFTRVAKDGGLVFCCRKKANPIDVGNRQDEDIKADISVVQVQASEDSQMLREVVNFLRDMKDKEAQSERNALLADRADKAFFWVYFIIAVAYFSAMHCVMTMYTCTVNHFDFWY